MKKKSYLFSEIDLYYVYPMALTSQFALSIYKMEWAIQTTNWATGARSKAAGSPRKKSLDVIMNTE